MSMFSEMRTGSTVKLDEDGSGGGGAASAS